MAVCTRLISRSARALAAAALFASTAAFAGPTLIGDTVTATFSGGIFNASASALVVAGTSEFSSANLPPLSVPGEFIDIEATSITLNLGNGYFAPQIIVISDLDFLGEAAEVVGFSLVSGIPWLNDSMITFTSDSITIDVGTGQPVGGRAVISLDTRSTGVPEPASLLLAVAALAASAAAMRRRSSGAA